MTATGRYSLLYSPGVISVDIAAIDSRLEDRLEQARATNTQLLDGIVRTGSSALGLPAKIKMVDQSRASS